MISCDTNILLYAYNSAAPEHGAAFEFLSEHLEDPEFALSELVLLELYNLLRNPAVIQPAFSSSAAVLLIEELRSNPFWSVAKNTTDVSDRIWRVAGTTDFPRRAIFDARLAYSLAAEGVTRFATRNVADFRRFGTFEVFDPVSRP